MKTPGSGFSETYSVAEVSEALEVFAQTLSKKSEDLVSVDGGMGEDALFLSERAEGVSMASKALPEILATIRKIRENGRNKPKS